MKNPNSNELSSIRHSLAHVLAAAVLTLFPDAKLGIGPVTKDGCFYDFLLPRTLKEEDLSVIEKKMKEILKTHLLFERQECGIEETKKFFQEKNQSFKVELIEDLKKYGTTAWEEIQRIKDQKTTKKKITTVTLYKTGDFVDLCRGGHVTNTSEISADAFQLVRTAGAYWRGSEKNPQLQRIYAVSFKTKKDLDDYQKREGEIVKRDHRVIGQNLDLFSFHDVAPGSVFWHPNGMAIWNELEKLIREELSRLGYQEIQTPLMVKPLLFEQSGHLKHYQENMFRVLGRKDEAYYLKPMNCPESALVFMSKMRSWRDLPLRFSEIGRIHRNELSGTLGGLFRVRQITQDDGHIYLREDQVEEEFQSILTLSKKIYKLFGFDIRLKLATRPDDAMGDPKIWAQAEKTLETVLKTTGLPHEIKPKDGAFYAPKIDVHVKDSLERDWQLATLQLDIAMLPERLNLSYIDEKGQRQKPLAIHRAIYGSFERFIGILIEHYAGVFPVWLAPIQIAIIPVGKKHVKFAQNLSKEFQNEGFRATADSDDETVGYKIRRAEKFKIPSMLVIGDKEMKSSSLHVRFRGQKKVRKMSKKSFIQRIKEKIERRSQTL